MLSIQNLMEPSRTLWNPPDPYGTFQTLLEPARVFRALKNPLGP